MRTKSSKLSKQCSENECLKIWSKPSYIHVLWSENQLRCRISSNLLMQLLVYMVSNKMNHLLHNLCNQTYKDKTTMAVKVGTSVKRDKRRLVHQMLTTKTPSRTSWHISIRIRGLNLPGILKDPQKRLHLVQTTDTLFYMKLITTSELSPQIVHFSTACTISK